MNRTYENALAAATESPSRNRIIVIDSFSIATGLGILVKKAMKFAHEGKKAKEVEEQIREWIPKVYSVIATNSPSYLYYSGLIDLPQALVLETSGLIPVFMLEDGYLNPLQKVRSPESLFAFLSEFLDEYSDIDSVSIVRKMGYYAEETLSLVNHCHEINPETDFYDIPMKLHNLASFGPTAVIFTVVEK